MSFSTEDIAELLEAEQKVLKYLMDNNNSTNRILEHYLSLTGNFTSKVVSNWVSHPINAFHLLKRTSTLMPKLLKQNPNIQFDYNITELHNDYIRACHGLADLQEYFQFDLEKFSNGFMEGKTFFWYSKLIIHTE